MNQIYIGQPQEQNTQPNTFSIAFEQADKYLQILRNDHFAKVTVSLPDNVNDKQLRFMMHLSRILKAKVLFVSIYRDKSIYLIKKTQLLLKYSKN